MGAGTMRKKGGGGQSGRRRNGGRLRMFNFADLIDRPAWLCSECRKIKRRESERRPFIDGVAREVPGGARVEPDKVPGTTGQELLLLALDQRGFEEDGEGGREGAHCFIILFLSGDPRARDSTARYMSFFRVTNDALRAKRKKDQPRRGREKGRARGSGPERESNAGACPAHIFTAMNAR